MIMKGDRVDTKEFFEPQGLLAEGFPRFDLMLPGIGAAALGSTY